MLGGVFGEHQVKTSNLRSFFLSLGRRQRTAHLALIFSQTASYRSEESLGSLPYDLCLRRDHSWSFLLISTNICVFVHI